MYYYLVTFNATIDGLKTVYGKLGATIAEEDEDLAIREVKKEAERRCRQAYPGAKQVIVIAMDVEQVSGANEINAGKGFQL